MNQSLLKLQIGPVQDFIAQARSTRDLWSGSYLLSWLMATGINNLLQRLAEEGVGEEDMRRALVFPDPGLQPLLQLRQPSLFPPPIPLNAASLNAELLTPSLPNIFLARLPLERAKATELAEGVARGIEAEWKRIAEHSWRFCEKNGLVTETLKTRFDRQVDRFLSIAWQVQEMAASKEAKAVLGALPDGAAAVGKLGDAPPGAWAFAATLALNSWELDAVRQIREFKAWRASSECPGPAQEKDSLSGREEQIVGGADWWKSCVGTRQPHATLFRERHKGEYLGATNLIKRVWHLGYPELEHHLHAGRDREGKRIDFTFPSTLHITSHDPAKNEDDPGEPTPEDLPEGLDRYLAVLALDADAMGQWMSGAKFDTLVTEERLRDFSARLSRFGLSCARPIVEACDGRLIYSGGDDVLALLPADTALQCAKFLRDAFKGQPDFIEELKSLAGALIEKHKEKAAASGKPWDQYHRSPHLVAAAAGQLFAKPAQPHQHLRRIDTGTDLALPAQADVSAGLAIAHFKSPLQDVVRAAQAAERRAKRKLGRSAVAVTLVKRSGETIEWGSQWDSGGLETYGALMAALQESAVSNKFPHRVVELIEGYLTETSPLAAKSVEPFEGFSVLEVALREYRYALDRQGQNKDAPEFFKLLELAAEKPEAPGKLAIYLGQIRKEAQERLNEAKRGPAKWSSLPEQERRHLEHGPIEQPLQALIGLCQTVAFISRSLPEERREARSLQSEMKNPAERHPVS
ncbi:MAG: type III-B CRISPR-associated protein Cas10/Cmr2 [Limisphaerales bacterium]